MSKKTAVEKSCTLIPEESVGKDEPVAKEPVEESLKLFKAEYKRDMYYEQKPAAKIDFKYVIDKQGNFKMIPYSR